MKQGALIFLYFFSFIYYHFALKYTNVLINCNQRFLLDDLSFNVDLALVIKYICPL